MHDRDLVKKPKLVISRGQVLGSQKNKKKKKTTPNQDSS